MKSLLLTCLLALASCGRERNWAQTMTLTQPYTDEQLMELYHRPDTVIHRNDSIFIVNTRKNKILIETGIFTYLQYGYPLETPYVPIALTRQAMEAEKAGDQAEAKRCYQAIVDYFQYQFLTQKTGFENGGLSDLNEFFAQNVNVRLLVSYAYEKLGKLPEALVVLAPYLANVEAEKSKIQQRYLELCIKRYGKAATRHALETSGRTIRHNADEEAPEKDYWCVTVFGASLGISDFNTDSLSPQAAQQLVWRQSYYKLVK